MNINFEKLLTQHLPSELRLGLSEIVKSVSVPIISLYNDFKIWQDDMRLASVMTCQVMYLEAMLNYKLLGSFIRTIYITDGDQVTADFVINIPFNVTVDYTLLSAIINKYKMFGKRFSIGQSTITYNIAWVNPLCERESKSQNVAEFIYDNGYLGIQTRGLVNVDLVIHTRIYTQNDDFTWDFTISQGTDASTLIRPDDREDFQTWEILSVTPEQDATMIYAPGISATKNSGYQRATKLSITKFINGIQESVSLFDMKLQFIHSGVTYIEITDDELANMSLDEYNQRNEAYAAYITAVKQNDYPGIEVTTTGSRLLNNTACPIN